MKNQPLLRRFGFALDGLKASWKGEKSVRLHIMIIAAAILLLLFIMPKPVWWAILLLALGMMLVVELVNTAVERLIDRLHPDQHPDIKIVKDTLAAAVFIACTVTGLVFLLFLSIKM